MAVIKTNSEQIKMLARLMRAEAEGEGEPGMLMVGNVGVNRVRSDCLDFKDLRSLEDMIYQSPGGFEAVQKPYFYQKAREKDIRLAERVVDGQRFDPARYALWFFRPSGGCPATWYDQVSSGRYKAHCFYIPEQGECPNVY